MKKLFSGFILVFFTCSLYAQQTVVQLDDGVAPGSENWTQKEVQYIQFSGKMMRNVVNPISADSTSGF